MTDIPEHVYLDAAKALTASAVNAGMPEEFNAEQYTDDLATDIGFHVAITSAYRAGYGQGRDDEAAGVDVPDLTDPATQE